MLKTLGIKNNFLAIDKKYSNLIDSKIVILPAPYESTTSYGKGTKLGPKGILDSSAFVEFYDDEFDRELCFEKGIATVQSIDFKNRTGKPALFLIENQVEELLDSEKFIVTIGGEHTISTAPIKSHYQKYSDMSILHFDAHSDMRNSYEGSKYSHACFMSRVLEFFPANKLTQVGIRAQSIEEAKLIKEKKIKTFYASAIRKGSHGKNWQKKVVETLGKKVYITFDVDYFDPSLMPSTGTPEPDGFLYSETLDIFRELIKAKKQIIGLDVVELAPVKGVHHPDITTARLIYKILNFAFYNK